MVEKQKLNELETMQLRPVLPSEGLSFARTDELDGDPGWLGQERAVDAIRMGALTSHKDFNVFVLGQPGSGRHALAQSILAGIAKDRPVACDWVYVNNFEMPHKPVAIRLPAGAACRLRKMMETLVDDLANQIPALFESEDYQTRRRTIEEDFSAAHESEIAEVFDEARTAGVAIMRTPVGFSFAGLRGGEMLTQEQFDALGEEERAELEAAIDRIQQRMSEVLQAVPKREKEHRRQVEQLHYELASRGVDEVIREVQEAFAGEAAVVRYLEAVRRDLIENAELFLIGEGEEESGPFPVPTSKHFELPQFQRYRVNVMVANGSSGAGARFPCSGRRRMAAQQDGEHVGSDEPVEKGGGEPITRIGSEASRFLSAREEGGRRIAMRSDYRLPCHLREIGKTLRLDRDGAEKGHRLRVRQVRLEP